MMGRLHIDICKDPTHLLPGVRMQIKLTKARSELYLSKEADSKVVFKLLDAQLFVKRVRPNPAYLIAHNTALQAGAIAKYNMTRVELETFTFSSRSLSTYAIDKILRKNVRRGILEYLYFGVVIALSLLSGYQHPR